METYDQIWEKVEAWVQNNTFEHENFSNIEELVEMKNGRKISLAIPTKDEEETIGEIVLTIKSELMDKYPLLDEIAVIDSGSKDNTKEEAIKAGADFYLSEDHLKNGHIHTGKGENLWTSLYVLKGDIICWIDGDIANIHPRFVYGPVGALIKNKKLGYVKGFYERPLIEGKNIFPAGGGRVTEICFRPLINMFFPELTGFIQPLSGEYAGTREILEQIPFYIGYGVETGHLIDICSKFGLNKMAQVNLEERIHNNQDINALRKMAFGINQVIFKRAEELGRLKIMQEIQPLFNFPESYLGEYSLESVHIEEKLRNPIGGNKKYREKFNIKD